MKALQLQRFGEPREALMLVEIAPAPLHEGEVRVRVEASGLNPSDVANIRGSFKSTRLPRVIGRDFAGEIVEGPAELIGEKVWGSGADIGFTRDGAHAEMIDIPADAVCLRPNNLSAGESSTVGVPFTTAYAALEATGHKKGEWVIVTGAAGSVGRAAIELIHARGGFVIALVRDAHEQAVLDTDKVKAVASSEAGDLADVVRAATGDRGADVALNGIGGSVAPDLIASLAPGGRMAVYSAAFGGREFQVDLFAFYSNRLQMIGVTTAGMDCISSAVILNALRPNFENGRLGRPQFAARFPLEEYAVAYESLQRGTGKLIFEHNQ